MSKKTDKEPVVLGKVTEIACPGCGNIMELGMRRETCACQLRGCNYFGARFKVPSLPLEPADEVPQ